jgi:hypothetical protein
VQSSFYTACLHPPHFDVVPRKLISQLQPFSQRIHETSMVGFYSSVDSDDILLMRRTMTRDGVFHDTPHIARAAWNQTVCSAGVPSTAESMLIVVENQV